MAGTSVALFVFAYGLFSGYLEKTVVSGPMLYVLFGLGLALALAALMVRLGLLERDVEIPEQRRAHIAELGRIATEILNNLHNLAFKLRPASLDHLGLAASERTEPDH